MRLWTLHPCYLDSKGLLALWREALLARDVLRGRTKGYRRHPQLERFRDHPAPDDAIAVYLWHIYQEARKRGYAFDAGKVRKPPAGTKRIAVNAGQVQYEVRHLAKKLAVRDAAKRRALCASAQVKLHPLFRVRPGALEEWERV